MIAGEPLTVVLPPWQVTVQPISPTLQQFTQISPEGVGERVVVGQGDVVVGPGPNVVETEPEHFPLTQLDS